MAASIAMSSLATTMVDVDINLLRKDPILAAREDASLDATAPSSSCDFSHSTPESCSDGDSVEGSLGPTISPSNPLEDKEQSRRVSFSNVVVREFPRCLGDNPSVTDGPPLSIGWKPVAVYTKDVDDYEKQRDAEIEAIYSDIASKKGQEPITPRRRRKPFEFNLLCSERIMILHWECGTKNEFAAASGTVCSGAEIKQMMRDAQKTKRQRKTTKALLEFEDLQVKVEGCQRKIKKMLRGKRRSIEQKELEQWGSSTFRLNESYRPAEQQIKSCLKVRTIEDDDIGVNV